MREHVLASPFQDPSVGHRERFIPHDLAEILSHAHEIAVEVEMGIRQPRRVGGGAQRSWLSLSSASARFRSVMSRMIVEARHDLAGVVAQRRDCERDVDDTSVLGDARRLEPLNTFSSLQPGDDPGLLAHERWRDQKRDRPSHDLVLAVPEQPSRRRVPARDGSVETLAQDGVSRRHDDVGEMGFGRMDFLRRQGLGAASQKQFRDADNEFPTNQKDSEPKPVGEVAKRNENRMSDQSGQHDHGDAAGAPLTRAANITAGQKVT